jgi:hypothetical protein
VDRNGFADLSQAVVFAVSLNPFPEEAIFYEMPNRAIIDTYPRRSVLAAYLFKFERRMAGISFPEQGFFLERI